MLGLGKGKTKAQATSVADPSGVTEGLQRLALWTLGAVSVLIVAASVYMGGRWLLDPQNLPLRTVRVSGELHHLDEAALREVVLPQVQAGFLRIDARALRLAVEALPWVRRASVRRKWPDVLEIWVQERRAVARWGDDGLLSDDGAAFFPPVGQWPHGLPRLAGPEGGGPRVLAALRDAQKQLRPLQLQVARLSQDSRRAWQMTLNNGLVLLLGRDELQTRLRRFVSAYRRVLAGRVDEIERVDLRYTNGFAVGWRKATTG